MWQVDGYEDPCQGAPEVSKLPSSDTAEGGTSVGSTSSSNGGGEVVTVGFGALVRVAVGEGAALVGATVVGATVVGATVVGATVVGAAVVGAAVVGFGDFERVAVGEVLGSGSSSAPPRAAHRAPPPRPRTIARITATTIGVLDGFSCAGGSSGGSPAGICMVG